VISGKLNTGIEGAGKMHGYKYALIGDAAIGLLGLLLTLVFLPHVKPTKAPKAASLEEGGIAASEQDDNATETDVVVTTTTSHPQKQELAETHEKHEFEESQQRGDKDELPSSVIAQEEAMVVAKVQFA
jgi:hypothetical protein